MTSHWEPRNDSKAQQMTMTINACAGPGHACTARKTHIRTKSRRCDGTAARRKTKEACVRVQLKWGQQLGARTASVLLELRQCCQAARACAACCSKSRRTGELCAPHSAAPVPAAQEGDCEFEQLVGLRHGSGLLKSL